MAFEWDLFIMGSVFFPVLFYITVYLQKMFLHEHLSDVDVYVTAMR